MRSRGCLLFEVNTKHTDSFTFGVYVYIGVGTFRILGGPRFRILGGGGGGGARGAKFPVGT